MPSKENNVLEVIPHAGINRRFPQHKLTGEKKQYVWKSWNIINLDGKFYKVGGASRYDQTAKSGTCSWASRIYYEDGGDQKKYLFAVIGNKMFKGNDSTGALAQVEISGSTDITLQENFFPISEKLKLSDTVVTYLVDGKYFYKFAGNEAGVWERLPIKTDIDGNTVEPVFIHEYLDRLFVLVKNRNVILVSVNRDAENLNSATDSVLIELPPGDGGFPKALALHPNGYLYVIHEDYYAPISGSSPATFGVKPGDIVRGIGTRAPRSVKVVGNTIGFLNSKNNEYHLMNEETDLSYPIKLSELIDPVKADQTTCHIDTNLNALRIAYYPSGGTTLGDEEIYSLDEKKWCGQTRGRNISAYCQWNGAGDDGRILTGRSDTGLVMVNDSSRDFDGSGIHVFWASASYVADNNIRDVQFEDLFIDGKPTGNYTIPVTYYIDQRITTNGVAYPIMEGETFGSLPVTIAEQTDFLNRALFAIDRCKGRMIRFEIDWTATDRPLEFYGIYARYNADNARTFKQISGL